MNQSSNLHEFVEIAEKKFPSFAIVTFNSAEVWSNRNVLMHLYSSHVNLLKGLKFFIILKSLTTKFMEIYFHLVALAIPPLQMKTHKSKLIKPECRKFSWVRYEFQCDKSGSKIKVLSAILKKKWSWGALYILIIWDMLQKHKCSSRSFFFLILLVKP